MTSLEWPELDWGFMKVLITGASGSGTTTLGRALAAEIGAAFCDADELFWLATEPPFVEKRDRDERATLLAGSLRAARVVVAGSIMGWGRELEDAFELVVFLRLDTAIRIARLRERELERRGRVDPAFLAWAEQYDVGPPTGRSLEKQEAWLATLRCPVLRLEGDLTVEARLGKILAHRSVRLISPL
jgi:uridine kinase